MLGVTILLTMLKNVFKKIIVCPNCGQRSRVPIKPGKVLLITCPGCHHKFEIKFDNPVNAFQQRRGANSASFFDLKARLNSFKQLSLQQKWMTIITIIMVFISLRSCLSMNHPRQDKDMYPQQNNNQERDTQTDYLNI